MGNSSSNSSTHEPPRTFAPILTQEELDLEYFKFLDNCIISGSTWELFADNLLKHFTEDDGNRVTHEWQMLVERDQETTQDDDLFTAGHEFFNIAKNRYTNILPLDSTRVKLKDIEGVPCSDYINANFVVCGDRKYICCQAPLESTFSDFYRMVWEQNISVIVMLTKIVEGGKLKAHSYWPVEKGATEPYGEILITTLTDDPDPSKEVPYVQRRFQLTRGEETRPLTQFHFVAWPDFGTPDDPQPLLSMMDEVNALVDVSKENIVVHCSAGIGRTGSYIMIDYFRNGLSRTMERQKWSTSQQSYDPPTINIVKTTHRLRESRSGMVNSMEQFLFCYRVVEKCVRDLVYGKGGLTEHLKLSDKERQHLARKKARNERQSRKAQQPADNPISKSPHSHRHRSGHRPKSTSPGDIERSPSTERSMRHRYPDPNKLGKPRKHRRHGKLSKVPSREIQTSASSRELQSSSSSKSSLASQSSGPPRAAVLDRSVSMGAVSPPKARLASQSSSSSSISTSSSESDDSDV
eukprot:TRINITY_DN8824_c0_g1_i1.p1 TRINITY_DN8824_c0_g1~~TRINITY_DN8824_c0_g1_i1.p1  ORF type:complete len:522 (-),score=41.78 TRINITY_DN8824_c0_g1_i1:197-1762(-)